MASERLRQKKRGPTQIVKEVNKGRNELKAAHHLKK